MVDQVDLNREHGDAFYVTVAEMISALQQMPPSAKVLVTVSNNSGEDHRPVEETGIPLCLSMRKVAYHYYIGDEKVVEIYAC